MNRTPAQILLVASLLLVVVLSVWGPEATAAAEADLQPRGVDTAAAPRGPVWAKTPVRRPVSALAAVPATPRILVGLQAEAASRESGRPETADAAARLADVILPASMTVGALADLGLRPTDAIPGLDILVLSLIDPSDEAIAAAVAALSALPGVVWAEEEGTVSAMLTPDDQAYADQWGPPAVKLPAAWDVTTGSEDIVIAIVDTGIARDVPDFTGRIVAPYSVVYDSAAWPAWEDITGHGTGVAGVAAALGDNGVGIAGAAWAPAIMPVHITDTGQATDGALADGIRYAADNGADVINVSFGKHEQSNAISTAVTYARNHGAIIVAAAGNEGPGTGVTYPAALSGVIAVGATDRTDHWASFSCTGPELDLVAPGVDVWTWWTDPDSYWLEPVLGTSFASPLVAGVVALMLSRNPELTAAEVETILMETADDLSPEGRDPQTGFGLLDAQEAVDRSTPSDDTAFADVGDDHPYRAAITGMAAAGLITGFGDRTFRPEEAVKRAQFAKMVDGALEIAVTEDLTSPFTDLGPDESDTLYPHEYVAAAYANNITVGLTQSTFGPFRDVNRAQAISMLVRAVQRMRPGALSAPPPGYTGSVRTVAPAHDGNLRTAEYNGLLDGISGLGPDWDAWGAASRGEIAQMLWTVFLSR